MDALNISNLINENGDRDSEQVIVISDSDSNDGRTTKPKKVTNRKPALKKGKKISKNASSHKTPARPIPVKSSQSSIKNFFKIQSPKKTKSPDKSMNVYVPQQSKSQTPSIKPHKARRNILSLTPAIKNQRTPNGNGIPSPVVINEPCTPKGLMPLLESTIQNVLIPKPSPDRNQKTTGGKRKRALKEVPAYKVVEGTTFGVDAFQFGDIEGVTEYFLTHFHSDHYIGLRKSFSFPLHVSPITARLVQRFIGVDRMWICEHELNVPFYVDDTEIIFLDANHCPGAVMILFRLKGGRCLLHTGDFRACADMEMIPSFWNHHMDTVYLDTTYLATRGQFVAQMTSIDEAKLSVRTFLGFQGASKPLIMVGTYIIGKEKIWISIAETFNLKVWLEPIRRKAADCILEEDDPIRRRIVDRKEDAAMHIVALGETSYPLLNDYLNANPTFGRMLVIRPSGWEKPSKAKLKENARISVVGVQYSEHSSYDELKRFVRFLMPSKVISTVPICGKFLSKTKSVPDEWMAPEVKPHRHNYQTNITNFLAKAS